MLFNSVFFITLFLPAALLGWHLLWRMGRPGCAKVFLTGMSLWFYGYYNIHYLWILLCSLFFNYGISFFTFRQLSFVIERYNGNAPHYSMVDYVDFSEEISDITENLRRIKSRIAQYPNTRYRFLIPPYSMLWWDCAYVNGQRDKMLYVLERIFTELIGLENVEFYFFQDEEEIVCNLDNYMDMVHYSPKVNQYMLEQMAAGNRMVTAGDREDAIAGMRRFVDYISRERIFSYYQ